jgi:hypothetical protein
MSCKDLDKSNIVMSGIPHNHAEKSVTPCKKQSNFFPLIIFQYMKCSLWERSFKLESGNP